MTYPSSLGPKLYDEFLQKKEEIFKDNLTHLKQDTKEAVEKLREECLFISYDCLKTVKINANKMNYSLLRQINCIFILSCCTNAILEMPKQKLRKMAILILAIGSAAVLEICQHNYKVERLEYQTNLLLCVRNLQLDLILKQYSSLITKQIDI